jgi:hypothetical protein
MAVHPLSVKIHLITTIAAVLAMVILVTRSLLSAQTGTIAVAASVDQACSVVAAADPALPSVLTTALTTTGTHSVIAGTVAQSCNKKAGYILTVSSLNCPARAVGNLNAPAGAKLINGSPANEEYQMYSVTFTNPAPSPPMVGLLDTSCVPAVGRDVTGVKVTEQVSTIAIVFSTAVNQVGGDTAGAGTFSDTLTLDMSVK